MNQAGYFDPDPMVDDYGYGGGVHIYGAGVLTATNATLSGNTAYMGGGGIATVEDSTVSLTNATLYGNTGITNADASLQHQGINQASINLINTVFAPYHPLHCDGITALATDTNNNISSECAGRLKNTDENLLEPLTDNGGPTLTHGIQTGSALRDAGDNTACPAFDQRGVARPQDGDGVGDDDCDIGAIEVVGQNTVPVTLESFTIE